jgi:hypothetical protein
MFDKGDFMLFDSTDYIIVRPATKTFFAIPTDMGKRVADATAGAGGMAPKMTLTNVTVTLDTLGAGEVVAGLATQHYRLSINYTMTIDMSALGADAANFAPPPMVTTSTIDFLVAARPDIPPNPFMLRGGMEKKAMGMMSGLMGGAMQELADKTAVATKGLLSGTLPVKVTMSQHIAGGPGMSVGMESPTRSATSSASTSIPDSWFSLMASRRR